MENAKHTPGPWAVRNGCNVFADGDHVPLTNMAYIAVTGGLSGADTIDRDAANARLIAAAPDLLDVAIQCRAVLVTALAETSDDTARRVIQAKIALASAAIAKARGAA